MSAVIAVVIELAGWAILTAGFFLFLYLLSIDGRSRSTVAHE